MNDFYYKDTWVPQESLKQIQEGLVPETEAMRLGQCFLSLSPLFTPHVHITLPLPLSQLSLLSSLHGIDGCAKPMN